MNINPQYIQRTQEIFCEVMDLLHDVSAGQSGEDYDPNFAGWIAQVVLVQSGEMEQAMDVLNAMNDGLSDITQWILSSNHLLATLAVNNREAYNQLRVLFEEFKSILESSREENVNDAIQKLMDDLGLDFSSL